MFARRQSFGLPATLLIRPLLGPDARTSPVAAPTRIAVSAGQEFVTIPLRLLRAVVAGTTVAFELSVQGTSAPTDSLPRIFVQVRAEPISSASPTR